MRQHKYLQGKENWFIRMYFYLNSGVGILNNFRNLFLGIFALYFTLKLTNPVWLVVMLIVCVPILILMGHYNVHKVNKISEWLSTKFSTHYGIKTFELTQKQVKLLEEISNKLNVKK